MHVPGEFPQNVTQGDKVGTLSATCWQGTHMGFTWQSRAEPREGKDRRQIERAAPERVAPSPHHNGPEGFTPGSPQTVSRVLDGSRLPHMPKCLYSGFCVFSSHTRSTAPGPLQGPLHFEVSGRPFVERLHLRPQAPSPAPPGFCGRPPRASQVGSKPHSLSLPAVLPAVCPHGSPSGLRSCLHVHVGARPSLSSPSSPFHALPRAPGLRVQVQVQVLFAVLLRPPPRTPRHTGVHTQGQERTHARIYVCKASTQPGSHSHQHANMCAHNAPHGTLHECTRTHAAPARTHAFTHAHTVMHTCK